MAKSKATTETSIITALWRQRQSIYRDSEKTREKNVTEEQLRRLENISGAIAQSPASTRQEASIQVAVAWEIIECGAHGTLTRAALNNAYAALASANAVLNRRRFA